MRFFCLVALTAVVAGNGWQPVRADEKKAEPELTDAQFQRMLTDFLEDPLAAKAKDTAKKIIGFNMQTPKAAVMLGEDELKWIGKKEDDRSLLLLAAYVGGNTRSQLLTGVKQNDRHSGLIALFSVYRSLQKKDKDFKIAEVEELLKLHKNGKLLAYLAKLEEKKPTRLSPEEEAEIEKLRKQRE